MPLLAQPVKALLGRTQRRDAELRRETQIFGRKIRDKTSGISTMARMPLKHGTPESSCPARVAGIPGTKNTNVLHQFVSKGLNPA
jgi:hypothetical protein